MDEYLEADLRRARRDVAVAQQRRDDQVQAVAGLTGDAAVLARLVLIERERTLRLTEMCLAAVEHLDDDKADRSSRPIAPTTDSRASSSAAC